MPRLQAYYNLSKFHVGDTVYIYASDRTALEGPYLITSVPSQCRYQLCTEAGLAVDHGKVFPEEALTSSNVAPDPDPDNDILTELLRTVGTTSLRNTLETLTGALHSISDDAWSRISLSRSIAIGFGLPESASDPTPTLKALTGTLAITPQKDSGRAVLFNIVGAWFGKRYEQSGSYEDIDHAIKILQLAFDHTTESNSNRAGILSNLGGWNIALYERTRSMDDLHRAIKFSTLAVETSSEDHPDRPGRLNNLANALSNKFQRVGDIRDIDRAIELLEEASARVPPRQVNRATLYSNLAACYGLQYELLGLKSALEQAMRAAETAVNITSRDNPSQVKYLDRLYSLRRKALLDESSSLTGGSDDTVTISSINNTASVQQSVLTGASTVEEEAAERKEAIPKNTDTKWRVTMWIEEQLVIQTTNTLAEEPTFSEPEDMVQPLWSEEARNRVVSLLEATDAKPPTTLGEVVRDRIWPFYSNWLHKAIGPYSRTAEFNRNDDDSIASVSIFLTCKSLPGSRVQDIIKKYTMQLVPENFGFDQVFIEIGEGTSAPSTGTMEILTMSSEPWELRMGNGIMSSISEIKEGRPTGKLGSSGPWFLISNGNVCLYTNEHVVRPGMIKNHRSVMAYPSRSSIGDVALTSRKVITNIIGEDDSNDDATMECNNPEVNERVREANAFLADWAVIKLAKAPHRPIDMPHGTKETHCQHVNDIVHIPIRGTAVAVGAGERETFGKPYTAVYTTQINSDGMPTVLSPGMWRQNSIELACWSLSRSPKATYTKEEWYENGLGIPGDSGTGVIDCETGRLCGMVIGQIKNETRRQRTTLIIDIKDVVMDTQKVAKDTQTDANTDFETIELIKCRC
ncbi:hypothetical protein F4680DRAFT_435627 [Xylaria scruposa]|nr:hypothetical protein F4680DRAFT_435627 [Xylaria scruposa]